MLRIGSVVIRVKDLEKQTAFWSAALDYLPRGKDGGDADDFVLLRPRSGSGPNVSLDRVHSSLMIPPRIHLDLYAEDGSAEVQRLIGLGATEVQWDKKPADADYVILADPEGNRFCVIDLALTADAQRAVERSADRNPTRSAAPTNGRATRIERHARIGQSSGG